MSSINSIGLGISRYYQPPKTAAARNPEALQAVAEGNDDSHSSNATDQSANDIFGTALLMTLEQLGIDPDEFQRTFTAAMRGVSRGRPATSTRPSAHLNTLG